MLLLQKKANYVFTKDLSRNWGLINKMIFPLRVRWFNTQYYYSKWLERSNNILNKTYLSEYRN